MYVLVHVQCTRCIVIHVRTHTIYSTYMCTSCQMTSLSFPPSIHYDITVYDIIVYDIIVYDIIVYDITVYDIIVYDITVMTHV